MSPLQRRAFDRKPTRPRHRRPTLEALEPRRLLTTFVVTNTADTNTPGTLRYAINQANLTPGANDVVFNMPAASTPLTTSPAPGFNPTTQVWTIKLQSPLPAITRPLVVDGYSQAHDGVPFWYPADLASSPIANHVIYSSANTAVARDGNNALVRVVLDGSTLSPSSSPIGLEVEAQQVAIRGLAITGFQTGVQVDALDLNGDPVNGTLIQGNFIGDYPVYPVDAAITGNPLTAPDNVWLTSPGNSGAGVVVQAPNTTIGGENPQESNVIMGNGREGVVFEAGAVGGVVSGNQIGVMSVGTTRYFLTGNGYGGGQAFDGVLVRASSVLIGGTTSAAANVISGNAGDGVHVQGASARQVDVSSNLVGLPPGGGYVFGASNPGNGKNGVQLEDSASNWIIGNTISSNGGAGVRLNGATATGNAVASNLIGLTSDGKALKGNFLEGVAVLAPQNTIGPGNIISGNLRGIGVYGPVASGTLIQSNFIGTDVTGAVDLGNASEGVLIQDSSDDRILGDAKGSQVISGNNVGIGLSGQATTRTLVQGNFIGTNAAGTGAVPNAREGVFVYNSGGNLIGGAASTSAMNLISGNHWGVRLDSAGTTGNWVQGNIIGADVTGKLPLGNEVHGVVVSNSASGNTIGGADATVGNVIAFNFIAGVQIESGVGDPIFSNSIFQNGRIGIDLYSPSDPPSGVTPNAPPGTPGPNDMQAKPTLAAALNGAGGTIQGALQGLPNATFYLQFFSSPTPDPSGFGQGKTLIGGAVVTTDASGFVKFSVAATADVDPSAWVAATATNAATFDTSEFSNSVSAVPVEVRFSAASYPANVLAGWVRVDVQRAGNPNATVSVDYATSPGAAPSAIAGVDYASSSGALTFQPGEFQKSFWVQLLPNPSRTTTSSNLALTLSQPTVGATLAAPSTAVIEIADNLPPTVAFSAASYGAYSTSGSVVVTINRSGADLTGATYVNYATWGGTAVPGVDYSPTSGYATFLPGQTTAKFSVPILSAGGAAGTRSVGLYLGSPTGGATLGAQYTAELKIVALPAPAPVDVVPPAVTSQQLIYGVGGVTGMVLGFSKPLDPARAVDLGNYGYFVYKLGPDGVFGTRDDAYVAIASAIYDPSRYAVTLTFSQGLGSTGQARLVVNGLASATLSRGVADTSGNLLSGRGDGVPGGAYTTTFSLAAPRRAPAARALTARPRLRGR